MLGATPIVLTESRGKLLPVPHTLQPKKYAHGLWFSVGLTYTFQDNLISHIVLPHHFMSHPSHEIDIIWQSPYSDNISGYNMRD